LPDGGVVHDGQIWKTPHPQFNANFYLRADGTAGVGPQVFLGRVVAGRAARPITSVNTVANAARGHITLVNAHLAGTDVPPRCAVVRGTTRPNSYLRVTSVSTRMRWLPQLTAAQQALVGCGDTGRWLAQTVKPGATVRVVGGFTHGPLQMLVSGEELLIQNGKPYHDRHGHGVSGYHAETFACVSRSRHQVLFGTVDMGDWRITAGITQPQLRSWLLARGCWSAMSFDGGGSTEMVARDPVTGRIRIVNSPAYGMERAIPDGIFVFKK
jgi:hypothetical protein